MSPRTFAGAVYLPSEDDERLGNQIVRVYDAMKCGEWRTIHEIELITGDPGVSISRQLRFLREERFGGYIVEKRPRGLRSSGLFEYRVLPPDATALTKRVAGKRNPFMAGVMYAAKIMLEQPDMPAAKAALKSELLILKAKYST